VQTELKRSNEELRRANQDLETFAYSANHDLQEPLRTIAISAQLLERSRGTELQGEDARLLASIIGSASRMTALMQDLLDYVRATKYAEGQPPAVDAAIVLAGALQNLKGTIEEAGAIVTGDPLPIICVHPGRLAQVFQNLISNAIKYRGTEVPHVHISAEERDGWSVFSVVDNGIGIDAKFKHQIFGLFKRLHNRQEYPGSGIGLAICQRIIEQYGGRIWLEKSVAGGGSTFCFSIPSESR
jgi:light-regulated signal transduction histidine kinase (bacteriophytochrome)